MKNDKLNDDRQPIGAHTRDWEHARMTTQAVAFRVIAVNEDAAKGCVPVWAPSPLTAEEEAVLARLSVPNHE